MGLVDEDGAGIEGVELGQEEALQGVPAELRSLRDGKGRIVLSEPPADGKEREGARVELTIDQGIQATAERALARAVLGSHALSGMAVALSPTTGEVLAMASWPATNANAPRTPEELRNRVVTDAFEPGSTIKSFSISAALDSGVLQPTDAIDCGNGNYAIGGHVIHDHGGGLGWAGPSRIIAQSSNIGAAKIAGRLGKDRLRAGLAAFGFGEKTGVGLPGEVRGQLLLARSDVGLATQAFGQGPITATALQITNAFGAIANGGVLLRPWLLKRVVDPVSGDAVDEGKPLALRRAISPGTAATMTRWLLGVVEDPKGTGKKAALDGWRAAGKTGTAQKVDRISGGYSDKRFSSFVGFAPVEAPRIVVGVFIDEPRGEVFGGEVAAPAFKEIAEYALRVLDVRPAPALAARPAPAAEPEPRHAEEEEPETAAVGLSDGPLADGKVAVPPLDGLTARSAIRTLETLGSRCGAERQRAGGGAVSPPRARLSTVARGCG